jgi:hypothetical protein
LLVVLQVSVVGDDIAWLRPDAEGQLRAINPENGFFGVAPGTSWASNPVAMQTIFKDTIFRQGGGWFGLLCLLSCGSTLALHWPVITQNKETILFLRLGLGYYVMKWDGLFGLVLFTLYLFWWLFWFV